MFSPHKALIVGSALLGVIFWVFPCWEFFLHLLICSSILNLAGRGKDGCAGGAKGQQFTTAAQ
jgi:hypothetical protein